MSDDIPHPGHQLHPARLEEIRDLLARLLRHPADETESRKLLAECRTALVDLLNDRDHLVHANAEAGEQLAAWLGHI